jgi:hypothetical protein
MTAKKMTKNKPAIRKRIGPRKRQKEMARQIFISGEGLAGSKRERKASSDMFERDCWVRRAGLREGTSVYIMDLNF